MNCLKTLSAIGLLFIRPSDALIAWGRFLEVSDPPSKDRMVLVFWQAFENPLNAARFLISKNFMRRKPVKLGFSISINVFYKGLSIAHYCTIMEKLSSLASKCC